MEQITTLMEDKPEKQPVSTSNLTVQKLVRVHPKHTSKEQIVYESINESHTKSPFFVREFSGIHCSNLIQPIYKGARLSTESFSSLKQKIFLSAGYPKNESTSKKRAKTSHGDFRRFIYEAPMKSMLLAN